MSGWARHPGTLDGVVSRFPDGSSLFGFDARHLRLRVAAWLGAALLVSGYLVALVPLLGEPLREDWLTYVRGADAVFARQSPYADFQLAGPYVLGNAANGNGYVYPPSAAIVMAPFLHPFELWVALGLAVFLVGLVAVAWRHGMLLVVPGIAMVLASAALWTGTLSGAASAAMAGLLGIAYVGLPATGLGAVVKLFPASWLLLGWSRWVLVVAAIPVALSIALIGAGPWFDYIVVFRNAEPACRQFSSLVCVGVPPLVTYAIGSLLLLAALRASREWKLLALGVFPLVVADQIPMHYYALIVPGCVALVARASAIGPWSQPAVQPQAYARPVKVSAL
jgi:hypothetical protein